MKKSQRIIASTVLAGALIGIGAPVSAAAASATPTRAVAQVQTVDTHRAVSSAADIKITSSASTPATGSAAAASAEAKHSQAGRLGWVINKLKGLGGAAWNKLTDAARAGYAKFKEVYERVVPWLVRKAISVGATVYEVYVAVREIIGLF
ncbi:hypothetical protein NLX86_01280 [Streptomyces sp. A3M-1-3]|uniref:hypothetical protein n=1 Tax=Streptomyces sp. A3M-1-3 TaxID=2962044 RepID=UPI0020B66A5A|nr:hypothetical protein [Streptomyces sp. A3M-1-3]MCP3816818.1 hypothetical protein [Streptomyces sp. A3M-1-3]